MQSEEKIEISAALQEQIDAMGAERIKCVTDANDWLLRWREEALRVEIERTRADPRFLRLANTSESCIKALGGWSDQGRKSKGGAASYWSREVEPLLQRMTTGPESRLWREYHRAGGFDQGGWESEYFARLSGREPSRKRFKAKFDEFGANEFADEPLEPTPVAPNPGEVGVIRQALLPPLSRCAKAPFSFVVASKGSSGVGINENATLANLEGMGFASAQSQAYVVMGAGAATLSGIGARIDLPAGYDTLACQAFLDVEYEGFSMAAFSGSTASLDLVLSVVLSDGTRLDTRRTLVAIPSPFMCFRNVALKLTDVSLNIPATSIAGAAGPVQMYAGVEVFSAAAGIVGSSAARMAALYTLKALCIEAR